MILIQILAFLTFNLFLIPFGVSLVVLFEHPLLKLFPYLLATTAAFFLTISFMSLWAGIGCLVVTYTLCYYASKKHHEVLTVMHSSKRRIIVVKIEDNSTKFNAVLPLSIIKIVKILPRRFFITKKKTQLVNIKEFIDQIMDEAEGTTIEVSDKSSRISIKVI